jgi:hypothetical protein
VQHCCGTDDYAFSSASSMSRCSSQSLSQRSSSSLRPQRLRMKLTRACDAVHPPQCAADSLQSARTYRARVAPSGTSASHRGAVSIGVLRASVSDINKIIDAVAVKVGISAGRLAKPTRGNIQNDLNRICLLFGS